MHDACNSRCADAVAGFLAEAVALLSRKPHEFYETARGILSQHAIAASQPEHSLLVVAALRQAVRVTASSKMPAVARAAIASYVAGELLHATFLSSHSATAQAVLAGYVPIICSRPPSLKSPSLES